jgi:4-hydroxyphenylpyruvate dioxygenase
MRHAIATVCMSGTLEEKLSAAARAGFDGIELFEPDLISSPLSPEELRHHAAHLGLDIALYQPFRDFEGVSEAKLQRNLGRAESKFELMERLGAELLLLCSNVAEDAIDDDELAAEQLRRLADLAAERGKRVAYEALAWGRHVHDYDRAWSIVAAADHPALGTCLDSFHILSRGADPVGIREIPGKRIFFVQLADAPRLRLDVLQWSRHYRCFPGQGSFDIGKFVDCVVSTGYDGPLSLEVFNDVFRQADPHRTAIDAMRSLRVLEDALAQSPQRVASLPRAGELSGYAFVELAVDFRDATTVDHLLRAIGFVHVGDHRSKPVELWQHGAVRLVVNHDADIKEAVHIGAVALDTPEPAECTARAHALLARVVTPAHQPDEAEISAVAAPDGTLIFFCPTRREDGPSWFEDFNRAPDFVDAGSAAGFLGIDHVALSQPLDYFDEAASFYSSVLGLRAREREELASPDGLIRSRALADELARVRFVVNSPALGSGRGGVQPTVQHVAFSCADALAAARALAQRNVSRLPISDNYYDDLASRLDLEPSTLEEMRELGVLYDRIGDGEFLHFYIETPGSRTFFEVVERRGGYDGYGAVNSPVRMAAQRPRAVAGAPA